MCSVGRVFDSSTRLKIKIMGKHKERTGKTRVGAFLQKVGGVAPDLLNAASNIPGMGSLATVAKMIDGEPAMSKQEKAEALKLLELDYQDVQDARANETARDVSEHSSWLSKNIHEMIAIGVIVAWIVSWYAQPSIEVDVIFQAVMLILGYLYGRSRPQSDV